MTEVDDQLFQSFSDAMPYGVCFVDLRGKIVYWNEAAEAITGYMSHEVLGHAYRGDLLVNCSGDKPCTIVQCPVVDVLRDGRQVTADLFLRHKDGHRIPVRVSAFSLRDVKGEISAVAEIFDISTGRNEGTARAGQSAREFEIATGLPAIEETRERLKAAAHSQGASSSALILIEMSETQAILKHGGATLLHEALHASAKTIARLLPPECYIGCWSDWRLIAIVPECSPGTLPKLIATLEGVGSSCAVKWWGDRVMVKIGAVARYIRPPQEMPELLQELEQDFRNAAKRE